MQPMKQKKLAEKAHKGTRVNISKQLPREAAGNANVEIMNCMSVIFKRLSARGIACAVIFILAQIAAAAQGVTLTGKVTDTDGAPVIGAGGRVDAEDIFRHDYGSGRKVQILTSGRDGERAVLIGRNKRRCL